METTRLLERIAEASIACKASADTGSFDSALCSHLTAAIKDFAEVGLKGTRAIEPNFWSVVSAMTQAFPLLLGPCWSHATCQAGLEKPEMSLHFWVPQAAVDGSLVTLCSKLPSQPQVASAYAKSAPMRSKRVAELQVALEPLQDAHVQAMMQQAQRSSLTTADTTSAAESPLQAKPEASPNTRSPSRLDNEHMQQEAYSSAKGAVRAQEPCPATIVQEPAQVASGSPMTDFTDQQLSTGSPAMTLEQQALLIKGLQLSKQVQQAVEEVQSAAQGSLESLGHDRPSVQILCTLVESVLSHGLKSFAPRPQTPGWASYLPPKRATAFAVLQAAEGVTSSEGALGVRAVVEMAAGSSDEAKLRMWVRAGLNEGCLGARLLALRMSWELYDQWYDRWALLSQAERVTALFQDSLGSPARSHQDVASNRRFNASVKRKPRTINFNTALPVNPTPPLYPHSLPLSAPDQPRDQAPPSDSPAQSPMPSSPSAHPRMLSDVSLVSAPPSVTSGTATHEDAYSLNQGSHKQQADEAVHLASCSEEGVAPTVGRRKSSDQLGRALSSRDSMREGDFASLLLPGHSLSVSELDADLRGNSRASTSHPDSFLASPSTSTQPAAHTFPLSSAESLGHPVSKACRATVSTPIPASPDITTDPNDAQFRASSDGDLAAVMPEEDVHDKDAHVLPAGHMAQLEGLDGMSYSDLTAMLVSRTVPQPHHLGTAQETPASLPIPGSPLAHHSHGAHAQNSFGHKDMRPSSHSMSIGSRHGADTDSVVPASAIHSSSISNRQVDASLQEAGTEAEYTCVPAQEQPAATAETVDVQSTVGASDQHNACQIPPAVHSGSKHPSEADAHDVLHVLAGVQSSDDLSMQQLQTLAGMDAQSSDGTTTLCDSAPESISSLDVDDRLPSLGQAAATHRPGAGHIDDSTVLGLSDLSTEVMSSSLYAEETENVPEQQRAGSAEGTAMPGMDDMLVSVSYEALDAGSPHCDSDDAGCQASADANPEASPRAVFQWEGGSSVTSTPVHATVSHVTVTACEMLAEEGSGGSLYTAYLVEARSNLLQPSWIVRRRFRDFIRLRAALTSQPGVALSPAWDALSKAQSVRGQDRTAPHVVIQRQELLHTCLQELLALNSQSPTLSPLLAFLDPSLITMRGDSAGCGHKLAGAYQQQGC
ncbi:hypothetical protein WJX79_010685 [Trebouxia sp. C0005]